MGINQNFAGAAQVQNNNEEVPHTGKDFKTDESLGMDGIEVVLEDYNQ